MRLRIEGSSPLALCIVLSCLTLMYAALCWGYLPLGRLDSLTRMVWRKKYSRYGKFWIRVHLLKNLVSCVPPFCFVHVSAFPSHVIFGSVAAWCRRLYSQRGRSSCPVAVQPGGPCGSPPVLSQVFRLLQRSAVRLLVFFSRLLFIC